MFKDFEGNCNCKELWDNQTGGYVIIALQRLLKGEDNATDINFEHVRM